LVLDIAEKNTPFLMDNFEIEVFKMENVTSEIGLPLLTLDLGSSAKAGAEYDGKYLAFYPPGTQDASLRIVFWFDGTGSTTHPAISGAKFIKIDLSSVTNNQEGTWTRYSLIVNGINNSEYGTMFSAHGQAYAEGFSIQRIEIRYLSGGPLSTTGMPAHNFPSGLANIAKKREPKEQYKQLHFTKPPSQTKNGLLLSYEEQKIATEKDLDSLFIQTDPNYVEYYFNIFVDNEIDPELLCKIVPEATQELKGVFAHDPLDCKIRPGYDIPIEKIYNGEDTSDELPEC